MDFFFNFIIMFDELYVYYNFFLGKKNVVLFKIEWLGMFEKYCFQVKIFSLLWKFNINMWIKEKGNNNKFFYY